MARITVEDCLKKVDNQYDLVLLAKERTVQLNAGSLSSKYAAYKLIAFLTLFNGFSSDTTQCTKYRSESYL